MKDCCKASTRRVGLTACPSRCKITMALGNATPVAPSCINIPVEEGCHAKGYLSKRYPRTARLTPNRHLQNCGHLCPRLDGRPGQRLFDSNPNRSLSGPRPA